ncbi:MerR family transcriptional regulator [Frankia sp. QA3]|uniref:MerR family transcriptional regulator n=1 Tax=Frankia sp. QA3 TaxID=710111 RepID=UPI000269CE3B|nr:MerR family transcriptional regulator [Frankia sp. QA3]EIV95732.1 serine/threonine protein phosphatase [Frankia sp. QA3]
MALLTIGEFARRSRLSPKALRLYDELGLLRPRQVDPVTGYRRYAPEQLEQARLVAWLRRLGMPLARIRRVCELDGPAAAREVGAFWAETEADTAARRDLAAVLVEHLSRRAVDMSDPHPITPPATVAPTPVPASLLTLRHAALTDRGLVRPSNQDAVHAGSTVLAVADGFGAGGAAAGAAAVDALARLEAAPIPPGELLGFLADAVARANRAVQELVHPDSAAASHAVGTTLTAMLWTGSALALVHIGDSRAYLLRGGELRQITHDHTFVRSMVEDGRLRPEEAATHPQRLLLLRALDGSAATFPDIGLHEVRRGDRYLLCSDGLSGAVPAAALRRVLVTAAEPEQAVRELVALANGSGGADNVSCVVADVVPANATPVVAVG